MLVNLRRGMGATIQDLATAVYAQENVNPAYNNPGGLMYAGQPGTVGQAPNGLAIFSTLTAGQTAWVNQANLDITRGTCATGATVSTLSDLISCLTPPSDNDTATYISNVSAATGLDASSVLSTSLTNIDNSVSSVTGDLTDTSDDSDGDTTDDTGLWLAVGIAALIAGVVLFS
jgi:hypothetical protein